MAATADPSAATSEADTVTLHILGVNPSSPCFELDLPVTIAYDSAAVKAQIEEYTGRKVDFFKFVIPLDQIRYSLAS